MKNKYPHNPILIIDDEENILRSYEFAFFSYGINNVICCSDSRQAADIIKKNNVEIVLLDLIMPHISGDDLLKEISSEFPGIDVIMVTGLGKIDVVVQCMKNGASDFLMKPIKPEVLINRVNKSLRFKELQRENIKLQKRILSTSLNNPKAFSEIITRDKKMVSIFQYCEAIAETRQPVLITGETGTGKELFARALHKLSGLPGKFVPVNIAGFDDNLLSDTLFGHRKGAFTGATDNRPGMIEKSAGGTLFLDEIGDLKMASQVKLLRLLQEREYSPLGSDVTKISDTRILLATNLRIEELRVNEKFRRDLYYRIATHHVNIPPLRERVNDIKPLLEHFIRKASKELNKKPPSYHPELITRLKAYSFPGNIRELESMVFDAVSNHKSKMLSMKIFLSHIERNSGQINKTVTGVKPSSSIKGIFKEMEELPFIKHASNILIEEALERSEGNQSVAASMVGISPQALSARLKKIRSGQKYL